MRADSRLELVVVVDEDDPPLDEVILSEEKERRPTGARRADWWVDTGERPLRRRTYPDSLPYAEILKLRERRLHPKMETIRLELRSRPEPRRAFEVA